MPPQEPAAGLPEQPTLAQLQPAPPAAETQPSSLQPVQAAPHDPYLHPPQLAVAVANPAPSLVASQPVVPVETAMPFAEQAPQTPDPATPRPEPIPQLAETQPVATEALVEPNRAEPVAISPAEPAVAEQTPASEAATPQVVTNTAPAPEPAAPSPETPQAATPAEPAVLQAPAADPVAAQTTVPVASARHKPKLGMILAIIGGIIVVAALVVGGITMSKHAAATAEQHDKKVQADLQTLKGYLAKADTAVGSYPTLSQLNNPSWRAMYMAGLTPVTLSPNSSVLQLVSGKPTEDAYAYNPIPGGCDGTKTSICSSYTLATKLNNGKVSTISP